jgi:hypothetical protein
VIKNWTLSIYKSNIIKKTTTEISTHKESLPREKYNDRYLHYWNKL